MISGAPRGRALEEPAGGATGRRRELAGWAREVALRFAWAPIVILVLDALCWDVLGVYAEFPWIDAPIHFAGGVAITWFALGAADAAARRDLIGRPNRACLLALAVLAGTSATVFWEFFEFVSDRWLGTTSQLELGDTLSDMFFGVAGALVLVAVASKLFGALRRSAAE
jgi:hypothetical protein